VISVLVVDDSVVVRRMITDALADDPDIRVVGTAPNGKVALAKLDQLAPDLITLDIEMPVMDGIETLREIRRLRPRLPVVMFSTLTAAGATATLDALAAGASDYVTKPSNAGSISESIRGVREQLIPRIHALCRLVRPTRPTTAPAERLGPALAPGRPPTMPATAPPLRSAGTAASPLVRSVTPVRVDRPDVLAIGCSTGGPDALSQIVRALPAALSVPVVVVQHMPPVFTKMFAERLNRTASVRVVEAESGTPLEAGTVYLAPGDFHLEVARRGFGIQTQLTSAPLENFCRPAVDVLFRSVARVYGRSALAVILTGMGQDGKRGCEQLRTAGAEIVAQDEASSVVWGMPGAVVGAGLADAVLPLQDMANHLITRTAGGRGARPLEVTR
jgi:two-component system chemotaxis response regulator CheB